MTGFRFSIREILLVTLIVALLVGWGAQTWLRQWPTAKERALMEKRLEALNAVVEIKKMRVTQGIGEAKDLRDAQADALALELQLYTSKSERLKVLERNLAAQQQFEAIADARFNTGAGTQDDMLKAQADRLQAEIALERAKAGR